MICIKRALTGAVIGARCNDCGHMNVVHPGSHNPGVDACLLCELMGIVEAAKKILHPTMDPRLVKEVLENVRMTNEGPVLLDVKEFGDEH